MDAVTNIQMDRNTIGRMNTVVFHCRDKVVTANYITDVYLEWIDNARLRRTLNADTISIKGIDVSQLIEIVRCVGMHKFVDVISIIIDNKDNIGNVNLTVGSIMYLCMRNDVHLLYQMERNLQASHIKEMIVTWDSIKNMKMKMNEVTFL